MSASQYRFVQRALDDYALTLAELRAFTQTQLERSQRTSALTHEMRTYLDILRQARLDDPTNLPDPLPAPLVRGSLADELIFVYPDELCDALSDAQARLGYERTEE